MAGPFKHPPFPNLICSPIGMVDKKDTDEKRMIMHLSFPTGGSINDFIDPALCSTNYQSFDEAVEMVAVLGRFCYLAKTDVKSAFRILPIHFLDLACLGICFQDEFYVDLCLPFGSSISCALFESFAGAFHWIIVTFVRVFLKHYLDDFLLGHFTKSLCFKALQETQQLVEEIGVPLSPEKTVLPTQQISFLGLGIDTVKMIVFLPQDKRNSILNRLAWFLRRKRVTVRQIASLAGKLNFVTNAIPPGRSFCRRIYDVMSDRSMSEEVELDGTFKADLLVWQHLLLNYNSVRLIRKPREVPEHHCFTDATANPNLGWGAVWDNRWTTGKWTPNFVQSYNFSIDFLELYAVVVAVETFKVQWANSIVFIHSDNTPTVDVLHSMSSRSKDMMLLVRYLALTCMLHQIQIVSKYCPGGQNVKADALSRFQMAKFFQEHPTACADPDPCPQWMSPLSGDTLENLWL